MYILGNLYEQGKGTEINYTEAIKWYTKAAKLGNDRALTRIGEVLKKQRNAILKRQKETSARKAANQNMTPNHDSKQQLESNLEQEMRQAQSLKEQLAEKNAAALKAKEEAEHAAKLIQQQLEIINLEAEKARRNAEQARRQQEQLAQEKEKLKKLQDRLAEQESAKREMQKQATTPTLSQKSTSAPNTEFKSDPCDSPSAAFMSTCRWIDE